MSTSSNGDNNNMLDKGLSSNICESMKARLIPSSVSAHPSLSSSSPSTDPENNLNKTGTDKGGYIEIPVLNIDNQNYALKTPPSYSISRGGNNTSPDQVVVNVTTSEEQMRYAHSIATDLRLTALTCTCRAKSPPVSSKNAFISAPTSTSAHKLSSLFPLVDCRACFHTDCGPFCNNHPCPRLPPDPTLTSTLPKDVVSTYYYYATMFLFHIKVTSRLPCHLFLNILLNCWDGLCKNVLCIIFFMYFSRRFFFPHFIKSKIWL